MKEIKLPRVNVFNVDEIYPHKIGPFTIYIDRIVNTGTKEEIIPQLSVNSRFKDQEYYCGSFQGYESCENWFKGFQEYFSKEN